MYMFTCLQKQSARLLTSILSKQNLWIWKCREQKTKITTGGRYVTYCKTVIQAPMTTDKWSFTSTLFYNTCKCFLYKYPDYRHCLWANQSVLSATARLILKLHGLPGHASVTDAIQELLHWPVTYETYLLVYKCSIWSGTKLSDTVLCVTVWHCSFSVAFC